LDLFEIEQQIYDTAVKRIAEVGENGVIMLEEYEALTKQYGKLIKQLRKTLSFADKTSTELHEANMVLEEKAYMDALTSIHNRRYMELNLKRVVKSLARSHGVLSVLMIDVDYFKKYNDFYGHGMGDDCLKIVAKTLAGEMHRADDFVARYGGEEFVAVMPGADEAGVDRVGAKLLDCISALKIAHAKSGVAEHVTVSIGSATVYPIYGDRYVDYIHCADKALYRSKLDGRNRYTRNEFIRPEDENDVKANAV